METTQDAQENEIETELTEPNSLNRRGKSSLKRLKDRLKILDKIASDPKVKAAKQADVALEASSIEKLLFQTEREDKADKTLALNAQLTAQLTEANAEIARLNALTAELTRSTQRVVQRIPDDRVLGLQEQVRTLEELIKSVATLARSCEIESRTRHAVSLVIKYGRRKELMSVVEGLGVDFSSVAVALQKSETELLGLLQQAQQEGTGTPIWRAVLALQVSGSSRRAREATIPR